MYWDAQLAMATGKHNWQSIDQLAAGKDVNGHGRLADGAIKVDNDRITLPVKYLSRPYPQRLAADPKGFRDLAGGAVSGGGDDGELQALLLVQGWQAEQRKTVLAGTIRRTIWPKTSSGISVMSLSQHIRRAFCTG